MHIFLLFQLKSTLIIRCFLFGSWNLLFSLESCAPKHSWTHLGCLFTLTLLGPTSGLLTWTLLESMHGWFISRSLGCKQSLENHWPREWAIGRDCLGERNGIERSGLGLGAIRIRKKLKAVSSKGDFIFIIKLLKKKSSFDFPCLYNSTLH